MGLFSVFTNLLPSSALKLRFNSEPVTVVFEARFFILAAVKQPPRCSAHGLLECRCTQKWLLTTEAICNSFLTQSSSHTEEPGTQMHLPDLGHSSAGSQYTCVGGVQLLQRTPSAGFTSAGATWQMMWRIDSRGGKPPTSLVLVCVWTGEP